MPYILLLLRFKTRKHKKSKKFIKKEYDYNKTYCNLISFFFLLLVVLLIFICYYFYGNRKEIKMQIFWSLLNGYLRDDFKREWVRFPRIILMLLISPWMFFQTQSVNPKRNSQLIEKINRKNLWIWIRKENKEANTDIQNNLKIHKKKKHEIYEYFYFYFYRTKY